MMIDITDSNNSSSNNNSSSRRSNQYYGWLPDIPDIRDHYYIGRVIRDLPSQVDLRDQCPKSIYDQGLLGSCTANAIAAAIEFDLIKQGSEAFTPSRLFIYYNERVIEGSVSEDSGAMLRDGIKSVNEQGAPHETLWPYNISAFATKPSSLAYEDALLHQALAYSRIQRSLKQFKTVIASGYPFVFGFAVYSSFESDEVAQTGIVPMPGSNEKMMGGHAVLCCGYDDYHQSFIVRNSWGDDWGMKGYFMLPYGYLTNENLSDDMWFIRLVETCTPFK